MKFTKLKKIQLKATLFGLKEEKEQDLPTTDHKRMIQALKSMREDTSEKFDIKMVFLIVRIY